MGKEKPNIQTETADRILRIWDSPRERVMYDPKYFIESLIQIVNKDSETVPFLLNPSQEKYYIQRSSRDIILKARQQGFSSVIESLFLHDTMFNHNTQSVLIAHTTDAATLMFSRVKFMFEHLPERFRPHIKFSNRRELVFDKINSSFFIGSAEARDFGRGLTINNLHVCLHPDVLTLEEHGFVKPIRETGTPTLQWDGDLISIHVRMNAGQPIVVTPDHRILTQNGMRRADELIKGFDRIAQPKRNILDSITSLKIPFIKVHVPAKKKISKEDILFLLSIGMSKVALAKYCNISSRTIYKKLNDFPELKEKLEEEVGFAQVALDAEFGWIAGLFMAEGTCSPKKSEIGFVLNENEMHYAERIRDFFAKYSLYTSIKPIPKNHKINVSVYSKNWHRAFRKSFYHNNDKYIPDWVFGAGAEFCHGLVQGCFDGDGSDITNGMRLSSSRPQFVYQLRDIVAALGYGWSSVYHYVRKDKRVGWKDADSWFLSLSGLTFFKFIGQSFDTKKEFAGFHRFHYGKDNFVKARVRTSPHLAGQRWNEDEKFIFQDILKIEKVPYKGQLYDKIDQSDHRFRTVGGIVSNSEAGSPAFREDFFIGLLESVPRSGWIVIESTAQGEGGPFYEYYMGARNPKVPHRPVKNNFLAHYFPWYEHSEYREKILTGEILSYTEEELKLIAGLHLTPEQIKWRRMKKGIQGNKFVQEYPEDDDEEAFLKSGSPIFDNSLLNDIDKTLDAQRPDEIWLGGDLFVHRMAERGARYIIGVDPAEGDPRSDYSAAMVIRIHPYPLEQVALLVGLFTPDMLSEKIWKIGKAYNGAMIAVERNNHGHAVINQLTNGIVRRGVMKHPPYDALYVGPDKKVGWLTTSITKPQMIDELDRAIRGGEIVIKNKRFISEAKKFTHLGQGKMGGKPDDVVMAMATALIAAIAGRFQWSM